MSDSNALSILGSQRYWNLPEEIIDLDVPEFTYPSGTRAEFNDTVSICITHFQRIFDAKSGLEIYVLNVPKDLRAIDETEGILKNLSQKLKDQNIEPVDLVKRAWKTSE